MRRSSGITPSGPELHDEAIRLVGEVKSDREALRSDGAGGARNYHQTTAPHVDVGNLLNRNVEINRVEVVHILLVQVTAISQADTKPTARIKLDTRDHVNRVVIESVRSVTSNVHRRTNFSDGLDVLVKREVKTDTREKLIRPIQQDKVTRSLRVAVEDVATVG